MGEPKPFASLTSGLLARKGDAKPAMRRQNIGNPGGLAMGHEDLGWNDMGEDGGLSASGPFSGLSPMGRSEEHTSELQSLMRNSYAVFCLKKKKRTIKLKLK